MKNTATDKRQEMRMWDKQKELATVLLKEYMHMEYTACFHKNMVL